MVFEEDLSRDTLNRLIKRIDEKLSLTDETEPEKCYRPPSWHDPHGEGTGIGEY